MDDDDGRCLLDVICDPQALNDFLHGSEKLDSDDLLDAPVESQSAFYEGPGLHVQEASGNHLNPEPNQPAPSVDLDFLEDDILGSPATGGGGGGGGAADQPCDILQQSLQEANITEQTLEAEAELDLGPFQLPTLQPADGGAGPTGAAGAATVAAGTQALFPGSADLLGLQAPPTVLTHQALVPPQDVVNKALSVQPFLQPVGLGNVTLQPIPGLQGLPNGSPGGATAATLGLAPIQVVGQPVMALNPPTSQLLAKQVPVSGYLASAAGPSEPVTLASAGVSPQGAGLVIQKSLPAAVTTTLNGNSVFAGAGAATAAASGTPSGQPLAVAPGLGTSPLVQAAPNVILHRTPTPIQPKPAGVLPPKLYQLTPKPFAPGGATLTIQGEPGTLPQQPKAPQNLTFMAAGKAGQNVVLSGFPAPALQANVFKQPPVTTAGTAPPQPPGALSKPMSVHLLNQGSSIVIPAQHMLPGQNQFLLPGAPAVQLPQPLSALPANVGGQILAAAAPHAGGQLIANPILTNQNLAGPLSLGPVLAPHSGAHSAAHILSAAPIQVGQPALFQMPVSLAAGSLPTQSQPAPTGPAGTTTVLQGVTLPPSAVAMLNTPDGLVQPATPAATAGEAAPVLAVQPAPPVPPAVSTPLPLGLPQPQVQQPPQAPTPQTATQPQATPPQASPGLASSPEKIVLGQPPSAATTTILTQDSLQMFLPQERSQQPLSTEGPHLSVPASVIVSAPPPAQDPALATPVAKGAGLGPQAPESRSSPAPAPQIPAAAPLKAPGPASSPSLPHQPPLGESPHLPSPHPARPPSRPPSRPHSRPPSQPQTLSRPPSEPALHPCPPPQGPPTLPGIFVIQNQLGAPPPASTPAPVAPGPTQPPMRPPSQPPEGPLPPAPPLPPASASPTAASASEPSTRLPVPTPPDFQLQFPPGQGSHKSPTPPPTLHLVPEPAVPPPPPPRTFQMVTTPYPALPQQKALLERFHQVTGGRNHLPPRALRLLVLTCVCLWPSPLLSHVSSQVPSGIILQSKAGGTATAPQTSTSLGPLTSPAASVLVSGQAPPGTPTASSHYDSKLSNLKKTPLLQPSKEACFLEHLHKHQGSVLHPDYKTAFPSFEDALHRLLPYHVYQGALPSPNDYHKVDEEFETVSTQLLKRTQAMLNKYRLLLLEESRRVSPSAEMVMIDRMFIQEEKTTLALDKQLAKENETLPRKKINNNAFRSLTGVLPPSHIPDLLYILFIYLRDKESLGHTRAPPLPPAKRRKSESPDVDQASFSSDSPQDDALTEHLQSAIDSILNLQQPPGRTPAAAFPPGGPASPAPLHRPDAFPPSSHNGGLGARTLNR
uniref:BRD4 interacting chromatin remodeling complex associated protein n=1 Tax=Jaculus jaculus TaxID=51337 RepID=A0A8C5K2M2_JACJA